ncbi:MAG: transporter substrate-binding domain-containing protein [Bacteroidales bacterium]|nr:transporter substrate-binding domain-containing protein [Bacteroidales bacterium]
MRKVLKILFFTLLINVNSAVFAGYFQEDTIYFKGNYDYPPYQLLDYELNPTGFSVEVLNAIATTMGLNIKIELDTWTQVRLDLGNNKIDGVAGMSSSPERSKTINFSAPFIYITHAVFVRNNSDIRDVSDLKDKKVLVVNGDIMHDYLISNNITRFIIPVKNYKTALRLLSAGEYDCALINKLHGQYAISEFNLSNLKPVGGSIQPKEICFAIKKDREDILAQINDGLQIIKSTGEYDQLYDKWFGIYEKTDVKTRVFNIILWILFPLLLVLFSTLIWSWSLRKKVANKTAELQNELNERKLTEQKLLHDKSLLNSMINSIPDLIFYKDKNNTYVGCNDAFLKFNELLGSEIVGKSDFELFPQHQAQYFHDTDQKIINEKKAIRTETWETNSKGEKFLLDTLKLPFTDEKGNPLGVVGICRDITERYKTEIDLKNAKEKAEESDRLKSSFLANMSHEIRTPMNAIIGFSDLLVAPDTETDEREELVTHINNNCNTLLHLIDDIIDLAKIEANELSIFIKETDVNNALKDLLETYNGVKNKVGKNHIEIKLDESSYKENFYLKTDPYRFKQIFTNITDNALKYTEIGSIEFGYKILDDINLVEFYVKDTGIGIAKDKQKEIFRRFNKIETDKSKLYRGTGLGLTITQNLIERLGGTIRVESDVNTGSVFYFTLPYSYTEKIQIKSAKPKLTKKFNNLENKTVLIVEDEESNYKYLEMLLKNKGLKLLKAENGYEAIEICKGHKHIDLVLMDIKMPGMNGLETTKEIKQFNPDIPIIIQTAYAMQNDEKISMEAGCDDYITKPIKKEKLFSIIAKWL